MIKNKKCEIFKQLTEKEVQYIQTWLFFFDYLFQTNSSKEFYYIYIHQEVLSMHELEVILSIGASTLKRQISLYNRFIHLVILLRNHSTFKDMTH